MADKTTSIQRHGSPKTRLLIVRQPVKSVRASDHPDPLPLRLAIGVIVALGATATVWALGWMGLRLGFASVIGLPELNAGPGESLRSGVMMLLTIPLVVLRMAIMAPIGLMICFLLIAVPAGGLAAARPHAPGGPRPHALTVVFSFAGAIAAALFAAGTVWWLDSDLRGSGLGEMPVIPSELADWLQALQFVAGMDALLVVAAAVWVVLVMRLSVPRWLRALSASAMYIGLVIMTAGAAMSCGAATHMTLPRTLLAHDAEMTSLQLVIGRSLDRLAVLNVRDEMVQIELIEPPPRLLVAGQQNVQSFVARRTPDQLAREE